MKETVPLFMNGDGEKLMLELSALSCLDSVLNQVAARFGILRKHLRLFAVWYLVVGCHCPFLELSGADSIVVSKFSSNMRPVTVKARVLFF